MKIKDILHKYRFQCFIFVIAFIFTGTLFTIIHFISSLTDVSSQQDNEQPQHIDNNKEVEDSTTVPQNHLLKTSLVTPPLQEVSIEIGPDGKIIYIKTGYQKTINKNEEQNSTKFSFNNLKLPFPNHDSVTTLWYDSVCFGYNKELKSITWIGRYLPITKTTAERNGFLKFTTSKTDKEFNVFINNDNCILENQERFLFENKWNVVSDVVKNYLFNKASVYEAVYTPETDEIRGMFIVIGITGNKSNPTKLWSCEYRIENSKISSSNYEYIENRNNATIKKCNKEFMEKLTGFTVF